MTARVARLGVCCIVLGEMLAAAICSTAGAAAPRCDAVLVMERQCVQHNEKEAAKMKVKADRQKKLEQQNTKAKSRMSKAQKKRMEREKAKQGA